MSTEAIMIAAAFGRIYKLMYDLADSESDERDEAIREQVREICREQLSAINPKGT